MSKKFVPLFMLAGAALLSVGAIKVVNSHHHSHVIDEAFIDENGSITEPMDIATHTEHQAPEDDYNENCVLVKSYEEIKKEQIALDISDIKELYPNSLWKKITFKTTKAFDAVSYLRRTGQFDAVDYDYIKKTDSDVVDISGNPYAGEMHFHDDMFIKDCWNYCKKNSFPIGGSSDVVVAVIDTGVDYNHVDLRNNIWHNVAEIPNNNIDDDDNGYIDDVVGWDFVNSDNDPIDDNGHGTHVAGSIAAENNSIGIVGAAFNCKVMPIKAASTSGYFTGSNIASAINYAYSNGASVINMSFGGATITIAEQDELESAYNTCNLIAAAGNSSRCDNPMCRKCDQPGVKSYPAALNYVVGVMSARDNTTVSAFSNYCHSDTYNVFASGEGILSTWPNNKYAVLNGTSMAAPQVSAAAAILRSIYQDRDAYSTKFINSQLTNTGVTNLYNYNLRNSRQDSLHYLINFERMIRVSPTPQITDFSIKCFDSTEISPNNNGNKIIEPGETIHVAIEAANRGGKASNIVATASQGGSGDPSLVDPNYTIVKSTLQMDDIGTYSIGDCNYIYNDNGEPIDSHNYFEVLIHDTCPDSYYFDLRINIAYKNGLDAGDQNNYSTSDLFTFEVLRGIILPRTIEEDTVLKRNCLYFVNQEVSVLPDVKLTIEEGVEIKSVLSGGKIYCFGQLLFQGSLDNPIYTEFIYYCGQNIECHYVDFFSSGIHPMYSDLDYIINCYNCSFSSSNSNYRKEAPCANYFEDCYFKGYDLIGNFLTASSLKCGFNRCCFVDSYVAPRYDFTNNICYDSSIEIGANSELMCKNNVFRECFLSFNRMALQGVFEDCKFEGDCNFFNYTDQYGYKIIDWTIQTGDADYSILWPYVQSLVFYDEQHNQITDVTLKEKFYIEINFNREMDVSAGFKLLFGSSEPYSDYSISGEFVSSTKWEGEYIIKAMIEGGIQHFTFQKGESLDHKQLLNDGYIFDFSIRSGGLFAMTLQTNATEEGIVLTWEQDDYDTLMGYNIYRSEQEDGNYVLLNRVLIDPETNTFIDDSCEPGKLYWYTFTVVLSDFSESQPAGKSSCYALDTIAPVIYHTPVNQAYENNSITIKCNVSDNISVTSVVLFYRIVGEAEWKSIQMIKSNDRFVGVIFGYEVTFAGLEYYISATDSYNTVTRGTSDSPYKIVVKDASLLNNIGDVDGDGLITTKDALMIIRAVNDELILTHDQFHRADLNKDGQLSTFEALRILQYVNGNVTTVEM